MKTTPGLLTVVGNRPQFIKMAPLSAELARRGYGEYIVHTGQHFDENMSGVFFEEMGIPAPDVTLGVASSLHGGMTGDMLIKLEQIMLEKKPRGVLIYGDTNSTLAAALAAVKLHIPIAHVEAGPRIYDMTTPEEINRTVADHAAALRFCPDLPSVQNLAKENITSGVYFTGDVMYDAFLKYSRPCEGRRNMVQELGLGGKRYALLTSHRPNNTDTKEAVQRLLALVRGAALPVVFPMHPRTVAAFKRFGLYEALCAEKNAVLCPALGYIEILQLIRAAEVVVTDSGGLQKEAFWAGKPVVIIIHVAVWHQIEACGWQALCWKGGGIDVPRALDLIESFRPKTERPQLFGDGRAAEKIVSVMEQEGWLYPHD